MTFALYCPLYFSSTKYINLKYINGQFKLVKGDITNMKFFINFNLITLIEYKFCSAFFKKTKIYVLVLYIYLLHIYTHTYT